MAREGYSAGQVTRDQYLVLDSNLDPEVRGEFYINLLATGAQRFLIDFRRLVQQGIIEAIILTVVAKAGTAYTALDVELLDTTSLSAALNSVNTLYRNTGISIAGGTPEPIINDATLNIPFNTKGGAGRVQLVITPTGGGGDSDWDLHIQIKGRERF